MDSLRVAKQLGKALLSRDWMLACAAAVTDIAGSSQWFDRGFVTYTNQAKQDMLGVSSQTLRQDGAVSETTVKEMVDGALSRSQAKIAVAVSGIAGPGGGTTEKPVGMVCFAWQIKGDKPVMRTEFFSGDRASVRQQSVHSALQGLLNVLEHH